MKILISTIFKDLHADAVTWWFSDSKHEVVLWANSDIPVKQLLSIHISNERRERVESKGENVNITFSDFDVVWSRRLYVQEISSEYDAADRAVAKNNLESLVNSGFYLGGESPFWVNDHKSAVYSEYKANQLSAARKCGLKIPDTLISNDPDDVRAFCKKHGGTVIFKPLDVMSWRSAKENLTVFTTPIKIEDLDDDDSVKSCPAIFQDYVEKDVELRIVVMGRTCVAISIASQLQKSSQHDWRLGEIEGERPPMELFELPSDIHSKCINLAKSMGLAYGAIDMVLTPSGDYIFIEINPMGQFLWMEESVPQLPLLDIFCQFLISGSADFIWQGNYSGKSLEQYYKSKSYYKFSNNIDVKNVPIEII
ncbi:hypothetical protein [Microbulbifer sediminum]|uniref:hypothetical protein n=1 Tax=Microbulbifer sediminum TaxID=2904250 RepID=UPI001F1AE38F|nr:hypothetical protein [Microbulbifer sediminum]